MIECLSPAGSYESFLAAIGAGADAVYIGGHKFGARAYANNFNEEEMIRAIHYAHLYHKKLYLTVNTLCRDDEMDQMYDFIEPLYRAGLDAVIVQDIGVISYLREAFPLLPIHASTQMTLTGVPGAEYLKSLGATRIVTSRELNLEEIREIKDRVDIEIESFVHGAMCYSYSGQCLFSGILGGRSGNRGRCAQPCRLPYDAYEQGRKTNRSNEQYLLSMRDMCALELIPELVEAGVVSFKIEGRMKKPSYTSGVTRIYRKYMTQYETYGRDGFYVEEADLRNLQTLYSRSGSGTGYYRQKNGPEMITLGKPGYESQTEKEFITTIKPIDLEGEFRCKTNKKMELELHLGEQKICVYGPVTEGSLNHPATEDEVLKQIRKTGDTPFLISKMKCHIQGECFLPVKVINELRREALKAMEELLLAPYNRESQNISFENTESGKINAESHEKSLFTAVVPDLKMLSALSSYHQISIFYLEADALLEKKDTCEELERIAAKLHKQEQKLMLALPFVFRKDTQKKFEKMAQNKEWELFDGFLVRNYEELFWIQNYRRRIGQKSVHDSVSMKGYKNEDSREVVSDFSLYSFNSRARKQLLCDGVNHDTVPLELNSKEMEELGITQSELLIYGYYPMMISAQCLSKTTGHCKGFSHEVTLKDRYKTDFRIQTKCPYCYNIIWNSVPLSLHKERKLISRLHPRYLRLQFSLESSEEAKQIVRFYTESKDCQQEISILKEYTKGHFKRGVE